MHKEMCCICAQILWLLWLNLQCEQTRSKLTVPFSSLSKLNLLSKFSDIVICSRPFCIQIFQYTQFFMMTAPTCQGCNGILG